MLRHETRLKRLIVAAETRADVARSTAERDAHVYDQLSVSWKVWRAVFEDDPDRREASVRQVREVLEIEGTEAGMRLAHSIGEALANEIRTAFPGGGSIMSSLFPDRRDYEAFRDECKAAALEAEAAR